MLEQAGRRRELRDGQARTDEGGERGCRGGVRVDRHEQIAAIDGDGRGIQAERLRDGGDGVRGVAVCEADAPRAQARRRRGDPVGRDGGPLDDEDGVVDDLVELGQDVARDEDRAPLRREAAQERAQLDPRLRIEAGSSRSSTRGSWTRARASPRRCFCPREKTRAGVSASSRSPSSSSRRAAPCSARGRSKPYRRPVVTRVSRAVSDGHAPSASGIHPVIARTPAASATGSMPPMRTVPASGARRDASISSSVVLPEPFGPTSPVTAPARAARFTSRTAWTAPNERRTPEATIPGDSMAPPYGSPSRTAHPPVPCTRSRRGCTRSRRRCTRSRRRCTRSRRGCTDGEHPHVKRRHPQAKRGHPQRKKARARSGWSAKTPSTPASAMICHSAA